MYYYDQILEKEKYWDELIKMGLINVYSIKCNNGMKDFYLAKARELKGYLNSDPNIEIKNVLEKVEYIIKKIDVIISKHDNGEKYDIKDLTNYFLINSNSNIVKVNKEEVNVSGIKSEVMKALNEYYYSNMPQIESTSID